MRNKSILLSVAVLIMSAVQAHAVTIDFEGTGAPVLFRSTTALTSIGGVAFSGPGGADGGAIINQAGNFGVAAHSGTDFLAFNRNALLSDGGIPQDPETITFPYLVSFVSIWAAGGFAVDNFQMDAFDSTGVLLGTTSANSQDWVEMVIFAEGIKSIMLTQTGGNSFVYDDLSFTAVPEPSTMLLLGSGLLGLAGFGRKRMKK